MPASIAHHVPGCPAFVPGIRLCGHGRSPIARSHDAPDPGGIVARLSRAVKQSKFVLSPTDRLKSSCFRRPLLIAFVLSPTRLRAFGDPTSCFRRPIYESGGSESREPGGFLRQALSRSGDGVIFTRVAAAFRRTRPFACSAVTSTSSKVKSGMVFSSTIRFSSKRKCFNEL